MKNLICFAMILTIIFGLNGCASSQIDDLINMDNILPTKETGESAVSTSNPESTPTNEDAEQNDLRFKASYTVNELEAVLKRENIVARIPGAELNNGQLQIYYWTQVYDYLNNNSYYLDYLGLDYQSPLDSQRAYDGSGTWQQYFLKEALEMWHSNISFAMLAQKNGYQMNAEYRAELDGMRAEMENDAKNNGFTSADAMLRDSMGPGCTMDDYIAYMEVYYLGYSYFAELYGNIDPTMNEIDAYFEANKEIFAEKNVTKESGYTVDVRHILISQYGDSGIDWDACEAEANRILDLWLSGDRSEESFALLADTYSNDKVEGGLYTGVKKGYMVETFDAWCFDVLRREGDYGIVRTSYGYHIIYFVNSEDIWITQARSHLISEQAEKMVNDLLEEYPIEIIYKKIVLGEVCLG